MFRGTFKFDNFYFNYHIEANQVNFSPFSRFEHRTPSVHRSVPPNLHLGSVFCPVAVVHYMYDLTAKHIHLFLKYYKANLDLIWYIASVGKRKQIVNFITHPPLANKNVVP